MHTLLLVSTGDPDDKTLRRVEKEILIAQKMKEKAKTEKCSPEVKGTFFCIHKIC